MSPAREECNRAARTAAVSRPCTAAPWLPYAPPSLTASAASLDRYFRNIKAATPLSADYVSVDYSLQLQLGITRAINDATANVTLPADLNAAGRATGRARPVATRMEEVIRDQK